MQSQGVGLKEECQPATLGPPPTEFPVPGILTFLQDEQMKRDSFNRLVLLSGIGTAWHGQTEP